MRTLVRGSVSSRAERCFAALCQKLPHCLEVTVQSFPPLASTNQGRIIKFPNRNQSLIAPVEPTSEDKQGRERARNKQPV